MAAKHHDTKKKHPKAWAWWLIGIGVLVIAAWYWMSQSKGTGSSAGGFSMQPARQNVFVGQPGFAAQNEATLVGQALSSRSNSQRKRTSPSKTVNTGSAIVATPHVVTSKAAILIPSGTTTHTVSGTAVATPYAEAQNPVYATVASASGTTSSSGLIRWTPSGQIAQQVRPRIESGNGRPISPAWTTDGTGTVSNFSTLHQATGTTWGLHRFIPYGTLPGAEIHLG